MQGEEWADCGDDLRSFADKAYPELQEDAREQLSINWYISGHDNRSADSVCCKIRIPNNRGGDR